MRTAASSGSCECSNIGGSQGGAGLGAAMAGATLGDGELPPVVARIGAGPAGRRRTGTAGVAQADGDITALGPAAGQVGSNRRYGSGAGCAPGAESSGGPAGRQKPRAQALGRPPGRPGWRANSNSKPPPLASSRAGTWVADCRRRLDQESGAERGGPPPPGTPGSGFGNRWRPG